MTRQKRSKVRKTNPQFVADKENQDRPERGKNEAGGMVSFVCRPRKHVGDGAADDRSNDAEHNRPENRHVGMHDGFRDRACD